MLEIADKVIDGIKLLRETAKKMQNAELQGQIADLMLASADLKMEMAELKSEVVTIREANIELQGRLDVLTKVEFAYDAYWQRRNDGSLDGPFSLHFWDFEKKLVRMKEINKGNFGNGRGECYQYLHKAPDESTTVPLLFLEEHDVRRPIEVKKQH